MSEPDSDHVSLTILSAVLGFISGAICLFLIFVSTTLRQGEISIFFIPFALFLGGPIGAVIAPLTWYFLFKGMSRHYSKVVVISFLSATFCGCGVALMGSEMAYVYSLTGYIVSILFLREGRQP